jgi:two-component system sensor histidine kinase YesM
VGSYIDKLILFNNQGIFVQAQGRQLGEPMDRDNIYRQPLFTRLTAENMSWANGFGRSISTMSRRDCYILLFRVTSPYRSSPDAFLYLETGIDIITDVLRNHRIPSGVFIHIPETRKVITADSPRLIQPLDENPAYIPAGTELPYRFRQGGRYYRIDRITTGNELFDLYKRTDIAYFAVDDMGILNTVLGTVFLSLLTAVWLVIILSMYITRPIRLLIDKIRKITVEKDFSHDPKIEKRSDEIGNIGYAINELSGSIRHFLIETEEQYKQQKNTEMALLQTQINPHFLYNTLDSIQWMAKIQNNHAIAGIIHRLTSLLRSIVIRSNSNTANASGMKITLADELLIIDDYTELMALRFMGNFEIKNKIPDIFYDCRIPRLTLQPLVENAIIHGLAPSEKFGVITLNATCEGSYLNITVEDSGIGISPEKLEFIKTGNKEKNQNNPSLNNIGIANVDARLKLFYGDSCGLFYESNPGVYTKVTVRIMMERQ